MQMIAYLAAYLIAGLGPFAIGVGAIAYLESHRPGGEWNSNTTTVIFGAAAVASSNLILAIKSIGNGQQGKENSSKLDHLHDCVEKRSAEVKVEASEAKKAASDAKTVAAETHKEVINAISAGTIPKEIKVDATIHGDP